MSNEALLAEGTNEVTITLDLEALAAYVAEEAEKDGVEITPEQIKYVLDAETGYYGTLGLIMTEEEVEDLVK